MGLSGMIKACRECPYRDTCEDKMMEALAYLPEPLSASASAPLMMPIASEVAIKHDYREIYIDNTCVRIDLEERDFYKDLRIGLMVG